MLIEPVDLGDGVGAWFTGRDPTVPAPPVGQAGNLAHRRPHRPGDLAAARARVAAATRTVVTDWHLMEQRHGAEIAVVDERTPPGAELRAVDGIVTRVPDRPLAVQVADCVPVLLAGPDVVAAVHAGRRGVAVGVVPAALASIAELGIAPTALRAVVGPAIGPCCYEVPPGMRDDFRAHHPATAGSTSWGTPSLDLPAGVAAQLAAAGVAHERSSVCVRCDERWFSHRRDADAGRQVGLVVLRGQGST